MKVGDLVTKPSPRIHGRGPRIHGRAERVIGVVVEVKGSICRVNFGDYGTFWQSPPQIKILS
tara:strand:+ start:2164 stop:2349 length:186 start_codon:yes stop_codon:yes gene_type:complete